MPALVRTSRTFPSTTTCTDTAGDVPALDAEKELSTSWSARLTDSGPVPAITQTPTSVGLSSTVAVSVRRRERVEMPGAAGRRGSPPRSCRRRVTSPAAVAPDRRRQARCLRRQQVPNVRRSSDTASGAARRRRASRACAERSSRRRRRAAMPTTTVARHDRSVGPQIGGPAWHVIGNLPPVSEEGFAGKRLGRTEAFKCTGGAPLANPQPSLQT